jgi:hypothetical protein
MSSATPAAVDSQSAYAILDRKQAALSAIDPKTLISVRVGRERVMELTHALIARAAPVLEKAAALSRPVFRKEYLTAQTELLADLTNRAMACYASDLDAEAGYTSAQQARRAELAGVVRRADRELFPVVDLLFGSDPVLGEEVRQIASGGGVRDDADDVLRLTRILLEHWSQVHNRAPVTRPGVEKAQAQATELAGMIDLTERENPKRDLQRRAFTHWVEAYDALNWLGRFVDRKIDGWPGVSGSTPSRRAQDEGAAPGSPEPMPTTGATPG